MLHHIGFVGFSQARRCTMEVSDMGGFGTIGEKCFFMYVD